MHALVKMLIELSLPISLVDRAPFKRFISVFDPAFNVPSRNTIKIGILPEMMSAVESKLKELLAQIEWVNVSVDGWSDATLRCFNGYIAQGIDDQWRMQTLPIAFQLVSGKTQVVKIINSMHNLLINIIN